MVRGRWTRLLASVMVSVLSLMGFTGGTALAGDVDPCSTTAAPFVVKVDAPLVEVKPDAEMEIKVMVSNCTAADWSGNVRLEVTPWGEAWCVPDGSFPGQTASVRAGDTRTLSFRDTQPLCLGTYTATATAFDTVDLATGSDLFAVYARPVKYRP
ncbi:MAG TPA: hypothetical protein VD969_22410 [Symbiobacteriaceae bacterium]|nr:hypothetical protein [Symbiobacteriaceae bacterium]